MKSRARQDDSGAVLLFVYGTLRRGVNHPMAKLLALRAVYRGGGRLNGRLYQVGQYPGVIFSHHPDEWVTGDLYDLKGAPRLLARLDRYEGIGSRRNRIAEYQRVKAPVLVDGGTKVLAWLYLYRLPTGRLRWLVSGDFARQRRRPPERAL